MTSPGFRVAQRQRRKDGYRRSVDRVSCVFPDGSLATEFDSIASPSRQRKRTLAAVPPGPGPGAKHSHRRAMASICYDAYGLEAQSIGNAFRMTQWTSSSAHLGCVVAVPTITSLGPISFA